MAVRRTRAHGINGSIKQFIIITIIPSPTTITLMIKAKSISFQHSSVNYADKKHQFTVCDVASSFLSLTPPFIKENTLVENGFNAFDYKDEEWNNDNDDNIPMALSRCISQTFFLELLKFTRTCTRTSVYIRVVLKCIMRNSPVILNFWIQTSDSIRFY